MDKSKRQFIKKAGQSSAMLILFAYGGGRLVASEKSIANLEQKWDGMLVKDPRALFDLPNGFSYKVVISSGDLMSDGLNYGKRPDGMAAFELNDGSTALVVNHETKSKDKSLNINTAYDGVNGRAYSGGTSTLVLESDGRTLKRSNRSLSGTIDNCAGGTTPWNTWISCEETYRENHGYAFEVDPESKSLDGYKRLTHMGRFQREAITVDLNDPEGCVYQTEDDYSGLFYKFIPSTKGQLSGPGKLFALKIPGIKNTSNKNGSISVGDSFPVEWVRIQDPSAKSVKTKTQGQNEGASIFNGGEGIIFTNDKDSTSNIFFTCKRGGQAGLGQIWKYSPSKSKISLFYESDNTNNLWEGDNINITPWGDLIICEDNDSNACKLIGCTPNGTLYPLGRVAGNSSSEIAGICFSPDGKNMYLNIQDEGKTIAISGDWNKIREYRDKLDSDLIHYKT